MRGFIFALLFFPHFYVMKYITILLNLRVVVVFLKLIAEVISTATLNAISQSPHAVSLYHQLRTEGTV